MATTPRPRNALTPTVRSAALAIFARYQATEVRVCGSVARGTDRPGSDVDFLATFPPNFSALAMADLVDDLEALLGIPVDVVVDDGRGGEVLARLLSTAVPFTCDAR
jgi:predicted nucleotidyltransferase